MPFNPYGAASAELAAVLVNTPRTITPKAMTALLAEHGTRQPTVDTAELAAVLEWTVELRAAFEAPTLELRVKVINQLLEEAASRPYVSCHNGLAPHLHYSRDDDNVVDRIRARTAAGLAHVLCQAEGGRLGCCARDGCTTVFVDISRNGRRRFCSTRCANRVYVADHRDRKVSSAHP